MANIAIGAKSGKHRYRAPASSVSFAVLDGLERLGSYRWTAGLWVAVDRRGAALGSFPTEQQAYDAIAAAGGSR
jgi:hypothetical protein